MLFALGGKKEIASRKWTMLTRVQLVAHLLFPFVQCAALKVKKPAGGAASEKRGITVETVWQGGLSHMAGIGSGDVLVGVNNVVWETRSPKKSYMKLHTELRTGGADLTLLVLPARSVLH